MGIFLIGEFIQSSLSVFDRLPVVGFLRIQLQPLLQHSSFVFGFLVPLDFLQPRIHLSLIDFLQRPQNTLFSPVFHLQFRKAGGDGFQFPLLRFNCSLFRRKVTCHNQRLGHQVTRPALILGLPFFVGLHNAVSLSHPAIRRENVAVVLHHLRPIVHQVLIHIVGIQQRRSFEEVKQILSDGGNQFLRMPVFAKAHQPWDVRLFPLLKKLGSIGIKRCKFSVTKNSRLHLSDGELQMGVTRAFRCLKQSRSHRRKHLPVSL